ncbi:iron-containing alcohol dehydrogenase family protein [Chelatococcus reniformis]|nr:iron-containing alcohol dehydrogenase family protein [Chelatococcus reniformis]
MPDSISFKHVTAGLRVHYGGDSLSQLAPEMRRLGCTRAVVVCGASVVRAGAVDLVRRAGLGDRLVGVFDGVRAHSPLAAVEAAAGAIRHAGADAVVALGGGSAIVTARAAAILLAEDGDIHQLCAQVRPGRPPMSPRLTRPKLPQFVVPTTPTTAYGKAGAAVLDPASGRRLTLFDPQTRAQALFMHPDLAMGAPPELVRSAALNTFVMAVQGLESLTREPLADAELMHALRLLLRRTGQLGTRDDSFAPRGELMLAALMCGRGTDHTTGALASVLGHAIGARLHLDNGLVNAVLLPHAMRFNAPATGRRLADLAELLRIDTSGDAVAPVVAAIEGFLKAMPIPQRLRDLGIDRDILPDVACDAEYDWFLHQNAQPIRGRDDLLGILLAAW